MIWNLVATLGDYHLAILRAVYSSYAVEFLINVKSTIDEINCRPVVELFITTETHAILQFSTRFLQ